MIVVAHELLEGNPAPSEAEIREAIGGNLCMCTGYVTIVRPSRSPPAGVGPADDARGGAGGWVGRAVPAEGGRAAGGGSRAILWTTRPAPSCTWAMLRSPHAHARIVALDVTAGAALPGVAAILTGAQAAALSKRSVR